MSETLDRARDCLKRGRPAEALELLTPLLEAEDSAVRAPALEAAGLACHALGRLEESAILFGRLLADLKELFGPRHPHVALALENVARLEQDRGRADLALPLGRDALTMLLQTLGTEHPEVARARLNLSTHLYALKRYDEAETEQKEALRVWEARDGRRSRHVATCLNNLGRLCEEKGELRRGVDLHREAVSIRRELLGEHPETAFSLANLGVALLSAGDLEEGARTLEEALALHDRLGSGASPEAATCRLNLATCRRLLGQAPDAGD